MERTLVLMAGLPGSGKSALALAIGEALGWPVVDKDVFKTTLLEAGSPESLAAPQAYALMFATGRDLLVHQRRSVILDSPLGQAATFENAKRLATEAGARTAVILCQTDAATRDLRMRGRPARASQPSSLEDPGGNPAYTWTHLPPDTLAVDTTRPLAETLPLILAFLREGAGVSVTPVTLFSDLPVVATPRLLLRRPRMEDAEDVFAYARDPEVSRYLPWEAHRTVEDSVSYLRRTLEENANGVRGTWAITPKDQDLMIGAFGFHEWRFRRASFGYSIGRTYWNQGLMTEVLAQMLRFGSEVMGLNRIEATCDNENVGSYRVMEKNGMRQEGLLRHHEEYKGRVRDTRIYAILREEWYSQGRPT